MILRQQLATASKILYPSTAMLRKDKTEGNENHRREHCPRCGKQAYCRDCGVCRNCKLSRSCEECEVEFPTITEAWEHVRVEHAN